MKILALDFDGVIVDSWYDALFCGFNSYIKFNKTNLFGNNKFSFDNFDESKRKYKKEFEKFRKLRPYIVNEKDYFVILKSIADNVKISNQKEFDEYKSNVGIPKEYSKAFYKEREKAQKDYKKWVNKLNPGFKIVDGIRRLGEENKIVIVTANRRNQIEEIFSEKFLNINVRDIIDDEVVIGKYAQLTYITKKYDIPFNDIYYVDDQVKNLLIVKHLVNCYLACWGYNNKEQIKSAKDSGIVLLNEDNFYSVLNRNLK